MPKCDGWSCQIIKTYHKDKKFKVRFTKCSDEHDEGNVEIVSMSRVVLDCLYCCRPVRDINDEKCYSCGNPWNEEFEYEEDEEDKKKEKSDYEKAVDRSWVRCFEHVPGGDYYEYNTMTHKRR